MVDQRAGPAGPQASRGGRLGWARTAFTRSAPILAAVAGILVVWYAATYLVLPQRQRFLLPLPHEAFGNALSNPQLMQPMLEALGRSVVVAMIGLVVAAVLGVGYAVVMSRSAWAEKILYSYAVILQTIRAVVGRWYGSVAR